MFAAIREDINSVFDRDPAARSVWEVVTCYPGLHARVLHRVGEAMQDTRMQACITGDDFPHRARGRIAVEYAIDVLADGGKHDRSIPE